MVIVLYGVVAPPAGVRGEWQDSDGNTSHLVLTPTVGDTGTTNPDWGACLIPGSFLSLLRQSFLLHQLLKVDDVFKVGDKP